MSDEINTVGVNQLRTSTSLGNKAKDDSVVPIPFTLSKRFKDLESREGLRRMERPLKAQGRNSKIDSNDDEDGEEGVGPAPYFEMDGTLINYMPTTQYKSLARKELPPSQLKFKSRLLRKNTVN